MCGCNSNVTFVKEEKAAAVAQFVVPAPKRKLTTSCDTLGKCGVVQENTFTASEQVAHGGTTVKFSDRRNSNSVGSNFPKETLYAVMVGSHLSAIGLRQLAQEFAAMADELDNQKTLVTIAGQANVIVKKAKKKKAAKKKSK